PTAAERLRRPIGKYITIEGDLSLCSAQMTNILTENLSEMLPPGSALVVGLGNRDITPDIVGVSAAESVMATRHLPKAEMKAVGLGDLREVCVLAPGVMGQTGLEVCDIVRSVARDNKFDFVIAIDSLAARSANRLGRTIQLSNVGISPGSGVLNDRAEISKSSLGIPVFSLGIPTVVDSATLIYDLCPDCGGITQNMMVTPRGIDKIAKQGANIISKALNRALQPQLSHDDIDLLLS
ncbi:MAG: GPR endopeptidase, partial [Oscillospiraceae bacterium]|nr:GPR endopeptidase [Oscillospiraceae bacterium]